MAVDARSKSEDSFDVVALLWGQRRMIILVTLAACVLGAVVSFLVHERFKSQVVLFPAVSNSPSRATLLDGGSRDDLLGIGDEEDAQQLLQMLQSNELRVRTEDQFDLMAAYRIEPTGKHARSDLHEAYDEHVTFDYTKYGSVSISVWDEDATRAAEVANYISDEVDSVWNDMQHVRAEVGVDLLDRKLKEVDDRIAQLNDSLERVRETGVHDYHTQSERFNQALGEAIVKGDQRAVQQLDDRFKTLARYGGTYTIVQSLLDNEMWRQGYLRTQIMQARADLQVDLPHKFIVQRAVPSDKKSYPVRWLMVVVSALSGFMFALLLVVVRTNLKRFNMMA